MLFVAYPEYWLLSTEFRYYEYPSHSDPDAVLTASTPTPTSGSGWNIDSCGVGTLLRPSEGAPHLQVRLCHQSMWSIRCDWIARTSAVSSQELHDISLTSPPCYIASQISPQVYPSDESSAEVVDYGDHDDHPNCREVTRSRLHPRITRRQIGLFEVRTIPVSMYNNPHKHALSSIALRQAALFPSSEHGCTDSTHFESMSSEAADAAATLALYHNV